MQQIVIVYALASLPKIYQPGVCPANLVIARNILEPTNVPTDTATHDILEHFCVIPEQVESCIVLIGLIPD